MEKRKITKNQSKDTGIVFGIVMLYIGIAFTSLFWLKLSFITLLTVLIVPGLFHFPAVVWFGFSDKLGWIVSKIVLGIIFVIIVLPVSLIRRLLKKDSMMLNNFKKPAQSSWVVREHKYTENDIQKPY